MKTAPEFIESINMQKKELFVLGEKVEDPAQHHILCPSLCALARNRAGIHHLEGSEVDGE